MNGVEVVENWLTPTVLFCIINLVIATIFIKSKQNLGNNKDELVRVRSFFERVNSIKLSYEAVPAQEQAADQQESEGPHHVTRSKSETVERVTPAPKLLKKYATEKVSPAKEKEAFGGEDEAVDAKADDFINRFRQQLKLERLDSILRYKEMANTGTGGV